MRARATRATAATSRSSAASRTSTPRSRSSSRPSASRAIFASRRPTRVVRYELPKLFAFNFVLDDVLEGGVNASLGLDGHGKALSFLLLAAPCASRALLEAEIGSGFGPQPNDRHPEEPP